MERVPHLAFPDEYKLRDTLDAAQDELVKLMNDREIMEWRINKLQNDIVHLAALCRVEVVDPLKQLGLTDAVRWIFVREGRPLTVKQMTIALEKSYSEALTYKNLSANVHTIFRRLKKAGEIKLSNEIPLTPPSIGGPIGEEDEDKYVWGGGLPPLPRPPAPIKPQTIANAIEQIARAVKK